MTSEVRFTLLAKAEELAALCDVRVAVVMHGPSETEPTVWPAVPEATDILHRYANLPDSSKDRSTLDYEGYLRQRIEKLRKEVDNDKIANRDRDINLIIHDLMLGCGQNIDDMSPELLADINSVLETRMKVATDRINFLCSEGAPAKLLRPPRDAELVTASQEPPMCPPLVVAPMVEGAPLALPTAAPPSAPASSPMD
ncbi:agamous-like MADS-box protein AGL80 [Phragmites australis]|uniref:agamous-like MADS-box protein AGL80 n=1 Tax=Phragmites australis TaxID=29695 RepID=UPI002D76F550|nr:agamous-like MADS-box protein AGL80 [Phragmites australis]